MNIIVLTAKYKDTNEELDIIIKENCKCGHCGKSIFDMDDFPEIIDNQILCEECYKDEYRDICPICEEYYDLNDVNKIPFPKAPFYWFNSQTKEEWEKYNSNQKYHKSGIYQAINHPIFTAATGGIGGSWIWWDNVEFICSIEDFIKANKGFIWEEYEEWLSDINREDCANFICDSCWNIALNIK